MPVNRLNFLAFDFETGGLKHGFHEAVQIGAKAYGPNFEPIGGEGGEFVSLMKPLHFDRLDPKALAVNCLTVEELQNAPDQGAVWKRFISWAAQWNVKGSGTFGGHPMGIAKNGSFDLGFVADLNALYAPKKAQQVIFSSKRFFDLEDEMFRWFGFSDELPSYKMDDFRPYLGMSNDDGHDALVDARQTGDIVMKFLKLYRTLATKTVPDGNGGTKPFISFRNSFKATA